MKTKLPTLVLASLFTGSVAFAQTVTESTTTIQQQPGVITAYDPATSVIEARISDGTAPVRYRYTKTTTFTDASGNVLSAEQVKTSSPATIYYTQVGSDFVASRVI